MQFRAGRSQTGDVIFYSGGIVENRFNRIGAWLYRRAENAMVLMLTTLFVLFLLQVVFRYGFNWPTGWTSELSAILWIWIVLFGAAFVVTEQEEMRFDLIYGAVGPKMRAAMFLIFAAALLILYSVSLPAVIDYVTFMRVEKTAYLKFRFDWVFSIYIIFVVAILVRYIWLSWRVLRGSAPDEFDATKAGSGV